MRTVERETLAEHERAVTVHVRRGFADLRRCGGLLRSPWRHRREGPLSLCSSRPHTRDTTPTAISSRGCLAAVLLQPGVELGRLIVQNDPIQETAPQGYADREHAPTERLAPGVRLQLVLVHP
jgi:hypothetical protein